MRDICLLQITFWAQERRGNFSTGHVLRVSRHQAHCATLSR